MNVKVEAYEKAGFGKRMGFGKKPAILIIDLQKGTTAKDSPLGYVKEYAKVVEETRKLIDKSRKKGLSIIYVVISFREDGKDCGVWGDKIPGLRVFTTNSKWVELDDRLEKKDEDCLIFKKTASPFVGTNLPILLKHLQIDTLIVAGVATAGCIRATATDSCSYGFKTIVPEECIADRDKGQHKASFLDIDQKYADVLPLEEVLKYIKSL